MRRSIVAFAVVSALTAVCVYADDDDNRGLQAVPFVFVGAAGACGPTAGSNIVTSTWLTGFGLPDNGGQNGVPATARDPHFGLLLSKNGPTSDCSAAGADIKGIRNGMTISELGFDFRNGTHCGAGAPRFNVTTTSGLVYFFGCANGTQTPAPQDPAQWTRVRFTAASPQFPSNPPFVFGSTQVKSVVIIFDEGTDSTSAQDPMGSGLVSLDNIDVNGTLITRGPRNNQEDNDRNDH